MQVADTVHRHCVPQLCAELCMLLTLSTDTASLSCVQNCASSELSQQAGSQPASTSVKRLLQSLVRQRTPPTPNQSLQMVYFNLRAPSHTQPVLGDGLFQPQRPLPHPTSPWRWSILTSEAPPTPNQSLEMVYFNLRGPSNTQPVLGDGLFQPPSPLQHPATACRWWLPMTTSEPPPTPSHCLQMVVTNDNLRAPSSTQPLLADGGYQ